MLIYRKYIRDCDRVYLAKDAYRRCIGVLEKKACQKPSTSDVSNQTWLMDIHRVWQYGVKQRLYTDKLNQILVTAYKTIHGITVSLL